MMHLCTPFLASTLESMMSKSLIKLLGGGGCWSEWLLLCCGCDGSWSLAAQNSGRLHCSSSSWFCALCLPPRAPHAVVGAQGARTFYSVLYSWGNMSARSNEAFSYLWLDIAI